MGQLNAQLPHRGLQCRVLRREVAPRCAIGAEDAAGVRGRYGRLAAAHQLP